MKKFTWMMLALCTLACGCSEDNEDLLKPDDVKKINGHEYVDLGLSVKWATCNVGADSPENYGDYFAWGEIAPKSEYKIENSITYGKEFESICGDAKYDAATANWGAPWRLPTAEECQELLDKCTWEWTSRGGHNGYKVTGPNGNSIFLPAAGMRGTSYGDRAGFYLSGTPYESENYPDLYNDENVRTLIFTMYSQLSVGSEGRYYGQSVRPVTKAGETSGSKAVEAPQNVVATLNGKAITVSWNGVKDATYNIYRSIDCVNYKLVASDVKTTTYTDKNPSIGVNYYRVKAKSQKVESKYSNMAIIIINSNNYESVDLGLSVKWATCNVGANSPEEWGAYFAWGEIAPKAEYPYEGITYGKELGSIYGDAKYDAATANWGAPWRLPTAEECQELLDKCTWEWTTQGGHGGSKVTGPNGNSIFLPAACCRIDTSIYTSIIATPQGYYWSGTPNESDATRAYDIWFYGGGGVHSGMSWPIRGVGFSVRPVTE